MRLIQNLLFALTAFGFMAGAAASPATPRNGIDYLTLPEVQPTEAGSKIEVTEFFAYSCPFCDAFDPVLHEWVKKQGNNIVFKRVHVALKPADVPLQRLFTTLDAMGVLEQYHTKVFDSIHRAQKARLSNDEDVFNWAEKTGLNRTQFIGVYRSFGMQANVSRANRMTNEYRIEQWPMIAIGGRFLTSPFHAGGHGESNLTVEQQQEAAIRVMDWLLAKVRAEKK